MIKAVTPTTNTRGSIRLHHAPRSVAAIASFRTSWPDRYCVPFSGAWLVCTSTPVLPVPPRQLAAEVVPQPVVTFLKVAAQTSSQRRIDAHRGRLRSFDTRAQ